MPPPSKPIISKAAGPRFAPSFDPWNSSSTGHQRPENQPGTGWRESRNKKLNSQFRAENSGGERLSDTWGAGAEDWDPERKVLIPKALRARKGNSVADMLLKPGKMRQKMLGDSKDQENQRNDDEEGATADLARKESEEEILMKQRQREDEERDARRGQQRGIFEGVVAYVNGSTYPLISDHKLKHILSDNGGQMSLHLGRRKVTHVILGRPVGVGAGAASRGAGGGLAGSKIEKEIRRVGGCGVKFVGAEWVLESLKAGKRLPEAGFSQMKLAAKGQGSVYGTYSDRIPSTNSSAGAGAS